MYRANPDDGIAWVTGASSGIGRAVAAELARRGYVVAATARRAPELATLAAEAAGAGCKIVAFPGDVTDRAAMDKLVGTIESVLGPIALGLLNAGGFVRDSPGVLGGDGFHQTVALNVSGTVNCFGPLLASMRRRGRGQIAVTGSIAGYGGLPQSAAYCASKSALIGLCESLRLELEGSGITIQLVSPGFVRTSPGDAVAMPFVVDVDVAARKICDGFARSGFEITFPRRLSYLLKFANMLPYPIYFWLVGKAAGQGGGSAMPDAGP